MAKLAPANVPVETHETDVAPAPPTKDAPRETAKSAPASRGGKPSDGPAHAPSSGPSAKEAAMVSSAERMAMDVLATMSNGSTATDRALKRGSDIPPVDVSAARLDPELRGLRERVNLTCGHFAAEVMGAASGSPQWVVTVAVPLD